MKSKIKIYGLILFMAVTSTLSSCGSDDQDDPDLPDLPDLPDSESVMTSEQKNTFSILANTTWRITSSKQYHSDGRVTDYLKINPEYDGATITFTDQRIHHDWYKILCSSFPNEYADWIFEPEYSDCSFFMTAQSGGMAAGHGGSFISIFGSGKIDMSISDNQLTLTCKNLSHIIKYERVSNSGNDGNGDYETPEVDFYDYTPRSATSVKVDYIIHNKSEAGVSSAVIKYGLSPNSMRSASTNLTGIHAIANISGLKANTDYYIMCEVKAKGGNVKTSTTRIRL